MCRAVPLTIIRSSFTIHLALVYVIQVCRQLSSRAGPDGQRNCPKHVEVHFLAKINLGNWCSCWFYYKDICYDARSHERKIAIGTLGTFAKSRKSPISFVVSVRPSTVYPHISAWLSLTDVREILYWGHLWKPV
jgi:hypothetical protein